MQRALRGKALEFVSSKLILPVLVPEVITTLRMLFGRPESILQNLLVKLRNGPHVNANKLETLIHFSLDVRNIVATMEAANLKNHLNNPMMIQEFLDRLPPQMRLDWAMYARHLSSATLPEFSDWLFSLAEAASSVTIGSVSVTEEKRKVSRVNLHGESESKTEKQHIELKYFGCGSNGQFVSQ